MTDTDSREREPLSTFLLRLGVLLAFAVALASMAPKAIFTLQHGACYPPGLMDYRLAAVKGATFYRSRVRGVLVCQVHFRGKVRDMGPAASEGPPQ